MAEQNRPFVVTDRRRFSADGEPRPDADPSPEREARQAAAAAAPAAGPTELEKPLQFKSAEAPEPMGEAMVTNPSNDSEMPPPPTASEIEQANAAYQQTAERLDSAVRMANPGIEPPAKITFDGIVQSIYMTAIMQLGGTTSEDQAPQVDLMAARQSIDMLGILEQKTKGSLTVNEGQLLDSALFELRMGFLEVTQAMARSAAARPQAGSPGSGPGRPSIVR